MKEPVNCLVMDDEKMFCESFAVLLEKSPHLKKVHKATTVKEASVILKLSPISILFADARMHKENSMEFIIRTRENFPNLRIIGITSYHEEATLTDFIRSGVHGILLKLSTDTEEINTCIKSVIESGTYWKADIQSLLIKAIASPAFQLTSREKELLHYLSMGLVAKEIAKVLGVKETTIIDKRKRLFEKTHTKNIAELVAFIHKNGLLD